MLAVSGSRYARHGGCVSLVSLFLSIFGRAKIHHVAYDLGLFCTKKHKPPTLQAMSTSSTDTEAQAMTAPLPDEKESVPTATGDDEKKVEVKEEKEKVEHFSWRKRRTSVWLS